MYKLLIFDLDDTIVNTFCNEFLRLRLVCKQYGITEFDEVRFKKFYGKPDFEGNLKRELGDEYREEILKDFYALSIKYPYNIIISTNYFNAMTFKKIIMGIVSNSRRCRCLKKLEKFGCDKWDFIYAIEDLECPKPDTKILSKLLVDYSIDASECAYIGDSTTDAVWAEKNNIDFFPVRTGVHKWNENIVSYGNVNEVIKHILNFD